jgi:hypothetical protein
MHNITWLARMVFSGNSRVIVHYAEHSCAVLGGISTPDNRMLRMLMQPLTCLYSSGLFSLHESKKYRFSVK